MPMILQNCDDRRAFTFGRASGLCSSDEVIRQLEDQLATEREQHRFNMAEKERELTMVLRELAEARYEAHRETITAFENLPVPSPWRH